MLQRMKSNDRWFLIIVGVFVSIVGASLALAILVGIGAYSGNSVADLVISLIGAVVGALIAIWGAVKIEDRKRSLQRRGDVDALWEAIGRLEYACIVMAGWTQQPGTPQQHILRDFADGAEILDFILKRAEIYDVQLWVALVDINDVAALHRLDARRLARSGGILDMVHVSRFRQGAELILPSIEAARQRFDAMK